MRKRKYRSPRWRENNFQFELGVTGLKSRWGTGDIVAVEM